MTYKEDLVANTKSDASAYMQFISGRKREGFRSYAFVEDDDDMVFFKHALHEEDSIGYLSCGGKENVLKVYRKLSSDGLSDHLLFFVDRDTESKPYEYGNDVCRTELYSWENYVLQPIACSRIISRRFRPTLTVAQQKKTKKNKTKTKNHKHKVLVLH